MADREPLVLLVDDAEDDREVYAHSTLRPVSVASRANKPIGDKRPRRPTSPASSASPPRS